VSHGAAVVLRIPFGWLLCSLLVSLTARVAAEPRIAGELAIESKLMAPCCWMQTLDVHESPLASELRAEIRTKLTRGLSAADIESDLVARYGARLWAIPPGHDPRSSIMDVGFGVLALTLIGLCVFAWRWRRKSSNALPSDPEAGAADAALDLAIDTELRNLDA
jgi:cytochrome c-type biogenesis protein CcmH